MKNDEKKRVFDISTQYALQFQYKNKKLKTFVKMNIYNIFMIIQKCYSNIH